MHEGQQSVHYTPLSLHMGAKSLHRFKAGNKKVCLGDDIRQPSSTPAKWTAELFITQLVTFSKLQLNHSVC